MDWISLALTAVETSHSAQIHPVSPDKRQRREGVLFLRKTMTNTFYFPDISSTNLMASSLLSYHLDPRLFFLFLYLPSRDQTPHYLTQSSNTDLFISFLLVSGGMICEHPFAFFQNTLSYYLPTSKSLDLFSDKIFLLFWEKQKQNQRRIS